MIMRKLVVFMILIMAALVYAQGDAYLELVRSDLKTEKKAIIVNVMELTDAESNVFWPIYREYEAERDKLGDRTIALLKDYVNNYDKLTDQKAEELVKESFKIRKEKLKLKEKYFKKMKKALSPKRAAQWLQLENQLDTILDFQIAEQLPLIQKDDIPAPDKK